MDRVEVPGPHRGEERGALDELVTRRRVQPTLRHPGSGVVGPADALQEGRDAAGRSDLADQLYRPDVDAELERGRRDEGLQLAGAQARFDPVAPVLGQAAMVRGDHVVAQPLAELVREAFGQPTGVHEHERGAVLEDQRGDAVEHVRHLLRARDRFELAFGQLDREVERALVPAVDDRGERPVTDQQASDGLDRALRGRQPDPVRPRVAQCLESLEREREVRAPLVARDRVDLVDDHGVDRLQRDAPARAGDQQVQRLRRRDHEARRGPHHARPLRARGVTGAHPDFDVRRVEPELARDLGDLTQGALQVLGDVDRERLQRRHVHDARDTGDRLTRLVGQVALVDALEERGERLARTGGRGDERVPARRDEGPAFALRRRRPFREAPAEPRADRGVEAIDARDRGTEAELMRSGRKRATLDGGHRPRQRNEHLFVPLLHSQSCRYRPSSSRSSRRSHTKNAERGAPSCRAETSPSHWSRRSENSAAGQSPISPSAS